MAKTFTKPQVKVIVGPDGFLSHSIPRSSYKTYRKMRRDPTIGFVRRLLRAPLVSAPWSIEPQVDAPPEAPELLKHTLLPKRRDIVRHALNGAIDFGWQAFEKVYNICEDGYTDIAWVKPLLQDFTDILVDYESGELLGVRQSPVTGGIEDFSLEAVMVMSFDAEGTDWYGEPMMETAKAPFEQWNTSNEAATRYDKKMAGAHWVVHYPPGRTDVAGTDTDNFEVAQKILNSLQASGTVAVPTTIDRFVDSLNENSPLTWRIELITAQGAQSSSFVERLKYLDALKARSFGFPERAIMEGNYGTKAEAEAHADFAIMSMELMMTQIDDDINEQLVNSWLEYNWGPTARGTVEVKTQSMVDAEKAFVRSLYMELFKNPDGMAHEMSVVDFNAIREKLSLPLLPVVEYTPVANPGDPANVQDPGSDPAISQ